MPERPPPAEGVSAEVGPPPRFHFFNSFFFSKFTEAGEGGSEAERYRRNYQKARRAC